VAIADFSGSDSSSLKAGTMITPPPIPNSPDNNPATNPIPAATQRCRASDLSDPGPEVSARDNPTRRCEAPGGGA